MSRKKKNDNDGFEYFQEMHFGGLVDKVPEEKQFKEKNIKYVDVPDIYPIDSRNFYKFKGSIKRFNDIVISNFETTTKAKSEAEAINNIKFQAKKKLGLEASAGGFALVGKVFRID